MNRGGVRRVVTVILLSVIACVLAYILAAIIVFDLRTPAYSNDEDNFNSVPVAFGPEPWPVFCIPEDGSAAGYSGSEWVWRPFSPICSIWRWVNGFAPPAEFRR